MVGPESQHCSHTSVQQLNTFSTAAESSNELRSPPAAALRRGKFCSKFLGMLTTTPGTNTVGVVVAIAATSPSAKSATEVIIMNFTPILSFVVKTCKQKTHKRAGTTTITTTTTTTMMIKHCRQEWNFVLRFSASVPSSPKCPKFAASKFIQAWKNPILVQNSRAQSTKPVVHLEHCNATQTRAPNPKRFFLSTNQ